MSSLPDPLSYLSQALQPNTPAPPQDASQAPPMAPPAANQGDQTTQPPQPAGRLRGLLSNFFQGAGAAMSHEVGLPTPYDKQQQAIQVGLQQQQAASIEGLRQAQVQSALGTEITPQMAQSIPMLSGLVGQRVPKPLLDSITKQSVANTAAGAKTGSAQITANSRENVADTAANSRENVATINGQTKTPNEIGLIQRMLAGDPEAKATLGQLQQNRVALAAARGQAMGSYRPGAYLDNDGNVVADFAGHAISQGFAPAAQGLSTMSKQAQFNEIKSGSTQLRGAIQGLDRDFTPDQRVKLTLAMRAPDESALHTIVNSMLGTEQLTPAQQNFVISATQMHERVLGMRGMAGIGGSGSDATRMAMQATIPNVNMADKAYGLKQLDAVDNQIDQLYKGVGKLKHSPVTNPPTPSGNVAPEGTRVQTSKGVLVKKSGQWVPE